MLKQDTVAICGSLFTKSTAPSWIVNLLICSIQVSYLCYVELVAFGCGLGVISLRMYEQNNSERRVLYTLNTSFMKAFCLSIALTC